jgi:hypothetical protein
MLYFYLFVLIWRRGGARACASNRGVSGDPASDFTSVLAHDERSGEGEGDTNTPTPSPQAAITIETSITRAPTS